MTSVINHYKYSCHSLGISSTLHDEISPLGLRSICVEFGYFRTSFLAPDQRKPKVTRISDYQAASEHLEVILQGTLCHDMVSLQWTNVSR
jgi:cbb3-type cytochrome oxidase cytochrome c subunit